MTSNNHVFLMQNLILKDFRIRYRNMSLGILWSLLNPLVMMGILTFVFTKIFQSKIPDFPVFVLCGLVPFNFYSLAWNVSTTSVLDNASLIKRVSIPREIVPISAVLSHCLHFFIQIGLLLVFAVGSGHMPNANWIYLPGIWMFLIVFVCGLSLASAALDVYIRDIRYFVESFNLVMFWLVPIFYSGDIVPEKYKALFLYNPVAAVVLSTRIILLEGRPPVETTLYKLVSVSLTVLLLGYGIFQLLKRRFADLV